MWFNPRMGMGPFRRGGLRMITLSILQQAPRNGAELIDQIEITSQGWWRPSPGSIYPMLEEMQREGFIRKKEDGKYEITEKAKQEYEWTCGMTKAQPRTVEDMIIEMNNYISYLEDLIKSDKSKIIPYLKKLKSIKDRLASILES